MGLIRRCCLVLKEGSLRKKRKLNLNNVCVCLFVWCIVYVLALPPHEAF